MDGCYDNLLHFTCDAMYRSSFCCILVLLNTNNMSLGSSFDVLLSMISCEIKGATTGGSGESGPPKFGRTTPTFLMKSVIIVT